MLTRRSFIGSALGALVAALLPVAKLLRADKPVLPIQSTPSGHVNPYLELKEFQRRWLELAGGNIAVMNGRGFREGQSVYWSQHCDPTSFEPCVVTRSARLYESMTKRERREIARLIREVRAEGGEWDSLDTQIALAAMRSGGIKPNQQVEWINYSATYGDDIKRLEESMVQSSLRLSPWRRALRKT